MTREKFLTTYRAELMARYSWANDVDRVSRFMSRVEITISTNRNLWHHDAPSTHSAWLKIGMPKRATLAGLRALPTEKTDDDKARPGSVLSEDDSSDNQDAVP